MKKFYQQINNAWRNAYGRHRQTGSAAHGHSVVGTDYSAGGAGAGGALNACFSGSAGAIVASIAKPTPPAVAHAGIRTGELTGHRLWWLLPDGSLSSLAHRRVWEPGETVCGNLNEPVWHDDWMMEVVWGGVYSFASPESVPKEAGLQLQNYTLWKNGIATMSGRYWNPYKESGTLVSGTVKMWGEVIEHERGYRAEFAKLTSIDDMHGFRGHRLVDLRARYGVR